jgi:hypothetical protein
MSKELEFRCPTCGGNHYGSSGHVSTLAPSRLTYHCHGQESYSPRDPLWPGWPGCGWQGTREDFLDNLHEVINE